MLIFPRLPLDAHDLTCRTHQNNVYTIEKCKQINSLPLPYPLVIKPKSIQIETKSLCYHLNFYDFLIPLLNQNATPFFFLIIIEGILADLEETA